MNGLAVAALIFIGVWLAVLTLVMLLVIRQIGVLTVQLSRAVPGFSVDKDGPEIGSAIPAEIVAKLPQIDDTRRITIMLISATCTPCRTLVDELQKYRFDSSVIALLAGRPELADSLVPLLTPRMHVVRDPEASQVAEAFNIHSTPFGVVVEGGKVIVKTYLHSADHFLALVDGHRTVASNAS